MNILIKNCTVLPMTAHESAPEKYFRGSIGIEGRNIAMVTRRDDEAMAFAARHGGNVRVIDGEGMLAMPGLINLHNHVSMTLMRGYADDLPLMTWLNDHIWPFEAKMNGDHVYEGAKLGIAEMLLGGTTCFADMYWYTARVGQAAREAGMRAVVCPTLLDGRHESFEQETVAILDEAASAGDGLVSVMVAPHAPYTCSPETLHKAVEMAKKYSLGIHTHISETLYEQETIFERYGKTPVEYLDSLGLFECRVLAAHCVYVSESDMEIMARKGVSVAHNPQSNMKLASGVAPVAKMLSKGVNVGIGTDGPSSNNDLDMWEEMRTASLLQKVSIPDPCALSAYQTLRMATVHGAAALGMAGSLGVIAEGALADIILIDTSKPHLWPKIDMIANLAYCGKASDVDTVIIGGKVAVDRRKVVNLDVEKCCRTVQAITEELSAGK